MGNLFSELNRFSEYVFAVYERAIEEYHIFNAVGKPINNPYREGQFEHLLYLKCWIDTVQWHLEDEIRTPDIREEKALRIKRQIDTLNQDRTNKVELIDDLILSVFAGITVVDNARINSESPAWALDRLSILALKIYHMRVEVDRKPALPKHVRACESKLSILNEQRSDLCLSINELLQDISQGRKKMKVYRQMKMYNDPSLNPAIYNSF